MSDARQLLGMKGASGTSNIWKLRLQLMKPVTWIPLIWGVVCGAAASGNYEWRLDHVGAALACMVMSGPLLAGYTQTINDYYDREIDAINEPYRPIPSGAISLGQVKVQIWGLLIAGLAVSWGLDVWAGHSTPVLFLLALGGSFVSFIYSAPPLKLKQNGWLGNYALGASYIALPWWAGQALFGQLYCTNGVFIESAHSLKLGNLFADLHVRSRIDSNMPDYVAPVIFVARFEGGDDSVIRTKLFPFFQGKVIKSLEYEIRTDNAPQPSERSHEG